VKRLLPPFLPPRRRRCGSPFRRLRRLRHRGARHGHAGEAQSTKQINVAVSADSFPLSFIKDNKGDPIGTRSTCASVIVQLGRAAGVPDLKTT
jgi:hypothetical protein